jgi:hypothetical protein
MRAIQYSRDREVKSRGHGVLDRPVKPGDDDGRKSRKAPGYCCGAMDCFAGARNDGIGCLKFESEDAPPSSFTR